MSRDFFTDTEPHKLIICGDIYDRGVQAQELQAFILDLIDRNEVILIRGNHEDLMLDLLNEWDEYSYLDKTNIQNGTVASMLQLTNFTVDNLKKILQK